MWETQAWSLDWEDPLKKGMTTHSAILAWRIPWTERGSWQDPRIQSMGDPKELDTTEWLTLSLFQCYPSPCPLERHGDTHRSPTTWELNTPLINLRNDPMAPQCKAFTKAFTKLHCTIQLFHWDQNAASYFPLCIQASFRCAYLDEIGNESAHWYLSPEDHDPCCWIDPCPLDMNSPARRGHW